MDNFTPPTLKLRRGEKYDRIEIMKFHERHHRTFLKSLSWFIVAFTVSFFVLYAFNGDIRISIIESLAVQALKFIFFYFHERLWNKLHFGKEFKTDAS